jgi:CubicO group peptidase (beta-lactamase class C family)
VNRRRLGVVAVCLSIALSAAAREGDTPQSFAEQAAASMRTETRLPAVGLLVQKDGVIVAELATGLRAVGHPATVTTQDRWHIGSCTKAFTATMIARLVDQDVLSFEDTLAESLPRLAGDMDPAYRSVTILQLLSHTAGLPPVTDDAEVPDFMAAIGSAQGVQAQRAAIARAYLGRPPASKVGEFKYSNLGYIVAGAIAEARTGKSWEDLIREQVFAPLGITQAGFGAPGRAGAIDEPLGHRGEAGRRVALDPGDPESDNPPALGPAGTINITLRDWLRFAQDQLDGAHGRGRLLEPATYRRLQTPVVGHYALGWGVKLGPDGVPLVLTHNGSNGYWFADIRILTDENVIVLIAANAFDEAVEQRTIDLDKALRERVAAR